MLENKRGKGRRLRNQKNLVSEFLAIVKFKLDVVPHFNMQLFGVFVCFRF